jgi:hypothetical protein
VSKVWILALMFLSAAVHAAHFDEVGGLTGIPHDGTYLPILGGFIVESETGEGLYLAGSKKLRLKRKGDTWRGTLELPAGVIRFEAAWTDLPGKLRFEGSLRASGKKAVSMAGVDYVFWLPLERFAGGQLLRVQPEDGSGDRPPLTLPGDEPAGTLVREPSAGITFLDAGRNWSVGIQLPEPHDITVEDPPGLRRRAFKICIRVHDGALRPGEAVPFAFVLSIVGTSTPATSAQPPPTI